MGLPLALLMLAFPTVLVVAAYLIPAAKWARRLIWPVLVAVWAIAAWLWFDYNRQMDDVGLMVSGIMAAAVSASAALATLLAAVLRRHG